jgi:hypothetical protein
MAVCEVSEGYCETSTGNFIDCAKGTLRHYRRTSILNELNDNKSAVFTRPSHGVN